MMGSVDCKYETPCGWCSKWDKKCDRKIPDQSDESKRKDKDKTEYNKSVDNSCIMSGHVWEPTNNILATGGYKYRCSRCGAVKSDSSSILTDPTVLSITKE